MSCSTRSNKPSTTAVLMRARGWSVTATAAVKVALVGGRYIERLAEAGIEPSVGSVGDSLDTQSCWGQTRVTR